MLNLCGTGLFSHHFEIDDMTGCWKKAWQISHCISFRDDANILFINQNVPVCHQGHANNEFITTYTLQLESSQNDMKHALAIKVPWSNN